MDLFTPQLLVNILVTGSIYALIGLSFSLIYKTTKFFDFSNGGLIIVSPYVLILVHSFGLPSYVSWLIAVLVTGFLSMCLYWFVFRKLENRGASRNVLLVASIGVLAITQSLFALLFSNQFQIIHTTFSYKILNILGANITPVQLVSIFISILLIILFYLFQKTNFGIQFRAVEDNEELANSVGISSNKVKATSFFFAGLIIGITGILVGMDTGFDPSIGSVFSFKGLTAILLGGLSGPVSAVGGFVLSLCENIGVWFTSGEWRDIFSFLVLIIVLVIRSRMNKKFK